MERDQPLTPPYAQPDTAPRPSPVAGYPATVTAHTPFLNNKKRPFRTVSNDLAIFQVME